MRQQARQAFVAVRLRESIDLRDSVLRDVLRLPQSVATEVLDDSAGAFLGPLRPTLLSMRELVHWQLMPKRQSSRGLIPVDEVELNQADANEARFSDDAVKTAADALTNLQEQVLLSELIGAREAAGYTDESIDAMVLQVVRTFGDENDSLGCRVDIAETGGLRQARHYGDDLWLIPEKREAANVEPS